MSHHAQHFLVLVACIAGCLHGPFASAQSAPATTQATEAQLRIQSLRISRAPAELQKHFSGRFHGDSNPAVSMQLLITLNDAALLTPARDAVSIETFVDDTYQHLLGTGGAAPQQSTQPMVSDDGRMVLFTVTANRAPADEATRVFVRGTVDARAARGEPKVESAKLPLTVGRQVMIGPFKTTIRSMSEVGGGSVSVMLTIDDPAGRIRSLRILDQDGLAVNTPHQTRLMQPGGPQPAHATVTVPAGIGGEVTLEYTYAEKIEPVQIPFEAQADIGVTSAGPLRSTDDKPQTGRNAAGARVWPPPPGANRPSLPPRRAAFEPTTKPAEGMAKIEKASVDLFSLSVGKPPPGSVEGVTWANPPAPSMRASGYTVARLLVSTPDAIILNVPANGVNITRFEDDKAGKLDTTLHRDVAGFTPPGRFSAFHSSPDSQQALLTVSLPSAPTPGATRCTLAGVVRATVARGDQSHSSTAGALKNGQRFTAGPFEARLGDVRLSPPPGPGATAGSLRADVWVHLTGPVSNVRATELLDAKTGRVIATRGGFYGDNAVTRRDPDNVSFGFTVEMPLPEQVIVRVRHHEATDQVEIPFELSTGIGL